MSIDYEGLRITAEVRELVAEFLVLQKRRQPLDRERELCLKEADGHNKERERLTVCLDGLHERINQGAVVASDPDLADQLLAEYALLHSKEERLLTYLDSLLTEQKGCCTRIREIRKQMEALKEEADRKGCDIDWDFPELE
jgi:hypothetical protein